MSKSPRFMQSVFSAFGDLYLYKLSDALYGETVASWSLFCQMTNWFTFFYMNRTLSNCLETVLTIMGIYYWPCIRDHLMDPLGFVSEIAGNWSKPPSHIVMFASEETKLRDFMIQRSFKEVKRFFHAHFKVDRHLQSSVVVYACCIQD